MIARHASNASRLLALLVLSAAALFAEDRRNELADLEENYTQGVRSLQLTEARVIDAADLLSELSGVNIITTRNASEQIVTLNLKRVTVEKAIELICRTADLWYRKDPDADIYRILTTEEYQKDIVIHKEERTKVFTLLHENVISAATSINDLFGERVVLSLGADSTGAAKGSISGGGTTGFGGANAGQPGNGLNNSLSRPGSGSTRGPISSPATELTTEQIVQLENLMQARAGTGNPTEADLQAVTGQEPPIYVTVNTQHNLILVRTSDDKAMTDIEKLMIELDRPIPQVLLEMKVLELTLGDGFQSSFDIEAVDSIQQTGPPSSQIINPLNNGLPTVGQNVLSLGRFPLEDNRMVYQFLNDSFRARIQLLASENRVTELATPIILAANNQQARIFIGEERVLTTGVNTSVVTPGNGATTSTVEPVTEIRDIGNTVAILPHINEDRTVTLTITQDSSSVAIGSATIPVTGGTGSVQSFNVDTVNTARIEGTIVATNNLTVAVGGLIRHRTAENRRKVPLLGDIPVLGGLFRRDIRETTKTELILLITPRVMRTPADGHEAIQARLNYLSSHPYHRKQEDALELPKITLDNQGRRIP